MCYLLGNRGKLDHGKSCLELAPHVSNISPLILKTEVAASHWETANLYIYVFKIKLFFCFFSIYFSVLKQDLLNGLVHGWEVGQSKKYIHDLKL